MAYPSTFSSFNRPTAGDKLNSPSHADLHNAVSSAVGQVEAVIGLSGNSSIIGTLIGDLRSPDSNGGGHVQTANKGGTGQTSFTKGDLLVATSSSVITKLAVGPDGLSLVSDSSVASGMKWGSASATKMLVNTSVVSIRSASTAETSIFSVTVLGSTLGTNNAIRSTTYIKMEALSNGASVMLSANYGGGPVASIALVPHLNISSYYGTLECLVAANSSASLQRTVMTLNVATPYGSPVGAMSSSVIGLYNMKTSSVLSEANQIFGVTIRPLSTGSNIDADITTVEKII